MTLYTNNNWNEDRAYIYDVFGRARIAEGTYVLSSSLEGQKFHP